MEIVPESLERMEPNGIRIKWSNGQQSELTAGCLREVCPCATCREKHKAAPKPAMLPVISLEEAQPLAIKGMTPVGNYAYNIAFSDGHDAGIYTFEFLLSLEAK